MNGFGDRLTAAIASRGPLCLGIDPHPELLRAWGLGVDAEGLARFSDICVQAFGGFAVVKPQVAFFEAYGSAGYAVLENTIAALRDAGVLVLLTPDGQALEIAAFGQRQAVHLPLPAARGEGRGKAEFAERIQHRGGVADGEAVSQGHGVDGAGARAGDRVDRRPGRRDRRGAEHGSAGTERGPAAVPRAGGRCRRAPVGGATGRREGAQADELEAAVMVPPSSKPTSRPTTVRGGPWKSSSSRTRAASCACRARAPAMLPSQPGKGLLTVAASTMAPVCRSQR